ncbi:MAG: hypothetical protein ACREOO_13340 [bacterium]
MKERFLLILCLAAVICFGGCNLFAPFHSDGGNDDPEALLSDARGALRDGRPQDALNLLDRAKSKLPANAPTSSQQAEILYFHAVATVRANNVSFQQFIEMMQAGSGSNLAKGGVPASSLQDEIILFDFDEQDLADLLRIFSAVQADLLPVVQALRNGTLPAGQFIYADDAYLSCGVAALVAGFVLMLDQDHNAVNGFRLDARLSIRKLDDTYQLFMTDASKTAQLIQQEVKAIICASYPTLQSGLECLWHYYNWSTFGKLATVNAPIPPATLLPGNVRDTASGIFFQVVHAGLTALYSYDHAGCP